MFKKSAVLNNLLWYGEFLPLLDLNSLGQIQRNDVRSNFYMLMLRQYVYMMLKTRVCSFYYFYTIKEQYNQIDGKLNY